MKRNYDYAFETFSTGSTMALKAIKGCYPFLDELAGDNKAALVQFTKHITNEVFPKASNVRSIGKITHLLTALA